MWPIRALFSLTAVALLGIAALIGRHLANVWENSDASNLGQTGVNFFFYGLLGLVFVGGAIWLISELIYDLRHNSDPDQKSIKQFANFQGRSE